MSEPNLRLLSLGAGVQSTTLALMAVEGILPGLDGAIFADTGWEPRRVYEHLSRLEKVLASAGIPLYRVSRGNLRDDVLDPHTQASIPFFSLGAPEKVVVIDRRERCPAFCGWAALQEGVENFEEWVRNGEPADDEITRAESELARIRPAANCEVCDSSGWIVTQSHTEWRRDKGMGPRRCTGRYKVEPIERQVRLMLGAPDRTVECRYCQGSGVRVPPWDAKAGPGSCSVCRGTGERITVGRVPVGKTAEQWIGFSTDEIGRVNNGRFPPYIRPRYPLLEKGWSRSECRRWLESLGWEVAKSACVACPFNGNRRWREMRDERPGEWADAVEFDRQFRRAPGLDSERFLHASRMPLDQAPIDRLTRDERADMQPSLLDLLEDGDPDGCSPYGCRSGEAVVSGG